MDGQEPQNTSGGASAARTGPGHGYHCAAAVARPRSGRSAASGARAGRADSPRRGSYRCGDATADRRSSSGLRTGAAAQAWCSGPGGPLDRRAPARAPPDLPDTSGAVRHGGRRARTDVRGAADDALPGDGHGHQPGDQGPAGCRDPHRRSAGPADRGARRPGARGRAGQAPVSGQRGPFVPFPAAGSDPARSDGRSGGARRDGRPERRGGPVAPHVRRSRGRPSARRGPDGRGQGDRRQGGRGQVRGGTGARGADAAAPWFHGAGRLPLSGAPQLHPARPAARRPDQHHAQSPDRSGSRRASGRSAAAAPSRRSARSRPRPGGR